MRKADLVTAISEKTGIAKVDVLVTLESFFKEVKDTLTEGENVYIRGFGSFANRNYKAYEGRNPKTGKVVKVPPKKVPFFKVGKELKEMVDAGKDKYVIREA